jgi:hypothetical protein
MFEGHPHLYVYNDNPRTTEDYGERLERLLGYIETDWLDIHGDCRTGYEIEREMGVA